MTGRKTDRNKELKTIIKSEIAGIPQENITFFCIGTPNCMGDSYGARVGEILKNLGYKNVIGTLDKPVNGENLNKKIDEIKEGQTVIAIDATLTKDTSNIGRILYQKGSILPGNGLGKFHLKQVGDYRITGCLGELKDNQDENYKLLCHFTKLDDVIRLVYSTVDIIKDAIPVV